MTPIVHFRNAFKLYTAILGQVDQVGVTVLTKSMDVIESLYGGERQEAEHDLSVMTRALYERLMAPGEDYEEIRRLMNVGRWPEVHAAMVKRVF